LLFYIVNTILRVIYALLYHPFAWTYDLVSWIVSVGQWNAWVKEVIPFIRGKNVLELGFGPGHLQLELNRMGFQIFGIDESHQMVKQASHNLKRKVTPINLTRGLSQKLPFESVFDTIVATFPSDYIFDLKTAKDISRVLVPGGRLIVLLSVSPGNSKSNYPKILSTALMRSGFDKFMQKLERLCKMYGDAGIITDIIRIPKDSVTLLFLLGEKSM
jgi:ubiquinone/menaquinone biosynthesis C-methylase UbiE